ncbi:bifunctional 2-polyprenyl-6-hydroxyphenol methylase/3-demethylubiquinol 3-O-methyltransferase UbiG [Maritimibacter sp. HL-12]|uniref:class I SAM-dependent methyltransferase n=1 Tax=Maritimibacter sp. HL-12 TaxID=1162418 RepID=UPI000A0F37D4|nr:class I SAM-dependent methyltransferase [Maritimibacter sp. HL-12]SMH55497.1 Ubiquinone/menaquinone biosynthesis C-methylase UbiE [Maritimibacter sp. HL-12]
MTNPARFWDRISARYARQPPADEASYARKLAQTRARLQPDWELLEIGCGTGTTAIAHAPHVKRVRAVDFSEKMLAHGRERAAREAVENVVFDCAALDEIDTSRPWDAVLMLSLLHLIPDWRGALDRAWALTRPGGIFVSSTACMATMSLPLRMVLPLLARLGLAPRLSSFSPDELAAAIAARGFEIEERWQPGPRDAVFIIARRPTERVVRES